jgi:hypothetical protein
MFKLLSALVDHSPTRKGREHIATDILAAMGNSDPVDSAKQMADH